MLRRLFTVAAAVSLLLFVTSCAMLGRSYQQLDSTSFAVGRERYIVRSQSGVLALSGPPPTGPKDDPQAEAAVAAAVRNDLIKWRIKRVSGWLDYYGREATVVGAPGGDRPNARLFCDSTDLLAALNLPDSGQPAKPLSPVMVHALLAALEDPDRALAAHCALAAARPGSTGLILSSAKWEMGPWPSGSMEFGGVMVWYEPRGDALGAGGTVGDAEELPARVRLTTSGAAWVRDAWHRRLGVQIQAVPWWSVGVTFAIVPTAWVIATVARWRRSLLTRRNGRRGLCTACGYDLRHTPDRCPECGRVVKTSFR
ncbi:MAG TPA: zinc ribbon domain-containing protein [Humisphaera sp.]